MRHFINKLKQKPEHHRKRYAILVSGFVVTAIFCIWIATLPTRLANLTDKGQAAAAASPLEVLKQDFANGYGTSNQAATAEPASAPVKVDSVQSSYITPQAPTPEPAISQPQASSEVIIEDVVDEPSSSVRYDEPTI